MPLIRLETSCDLGTVEQRQALTLSLSRIAADSIGKPEQYVMACVHDNLAMTMGGSDQSCALVSVQSIGGLDREVNQKLASAVGQLLEGEIDIPQDRVYCVFEERPATFWAWKGKTFG
ncbi:phenylpyruvate tautomerase MIF-related protein [Planctomycetota bacterium]